MSDQSSEGYRAALQMIAYGGTLIWTIFRSLLATNALLLALTGAILNIYPDLRVLPILLSLLGLLVCAAWILIMMRQMDYYRYWFAWARAFEADALGDFKMIREGKRYSEGESVVVNGGPERMRWGSRLFKVEWLVYMVVIAIGLVHGFLLWRAWQYEYIVGDGVGALTTHCSGRGNSGVLWLGGPVRREWWGFPRR